MGNFSGGSIKMEKLFQRFFNCATQEFKFLEKHGYQQVSNNIEHESDFRDAEAVAVYLGTTIGIKVTWYFAGAIIDVAFFELQNGKIPERICYFGSIPPNCTRGISLLTLAQYHGLIDDTNLLQKEVHSVMLSKVKKREILINENMEGVIKGLANVTKEIALNIYADGDVSEFSDVMELKGIKKY